MKNRIIKSLIIGIVMFMFLLVLFFPTEDRYDGSIDVYFGVMSIEFVGFLRFAITCGHGVSVLFVGIEILIGIIAGLVFYLLTEPRPPQKSMSPTEAIAIMKELSSRASK